MGDLTEHFSRKEFACKCNCGADDISEELVEKLELVRFIYKKPMTITSGVRCEKHNASPAVQGRKNSTHLKGWAADIAVSGCFQRDQLAGYLRMQFNRMGIAKTFIHVDVGDEHGKPSPCLWVY